MTIEIQIIKIGDSLYALIPKTLCDALNIKEKQPAEIRIEGDKLIIEVKGNSTH